MTSIKFIVWMVTTHVVAGPARIVLACLAIVASSAAVTWVVSGYDSLAAQFDENANSFLGRYDLLIVPTGVAFESVANLRRELIEALRHDAAVSEINPISQSRATITPAVARPSASTALDLLVGTRPPVNGAPPTDPMLVATEAAEEPYDLVEGRWLETESAKPEAVITHGAAKRMQIDVGDAILVTTMANRVRLTIVGIIQQPPDAPNIDTSLLTETRQTPRSSERETDPVAGEGRSSKRGITIPIGAVNFPAVEAVYVRNSVAEEVNGIPASIKVVQVALRDGFTPRDFRRVWSDRLLSERPSLIALDFGDIRAGMESSESLASQRIQALSGTALATLAAAFIIFTTLSMGVSERAREFALLRAVALTRGQVCAIILVEALLLAFVGWLGGMLVGRVILSWTAARSESLTVLNGLTWLTFVLTALSVLVGSLAASMISLWQAARIRPLDAAIGHRITDRRHWPQMCFVAGIVLVLIAPASVFLLSMGDSARTTAYAAVGYPSLFLGVALLAPALLIVAERFFAPLLARLLAINPLLLRSQLTNSLARTVGATLAVTSGLALFTATQIWGYTMLQFYIPGRWLPDALVAFQPLGVSSDNQPLITGTDGIRAVLPLAVEQAKFAWPETEAPPNLRRDNAVIFGFDPAAALAGVDPFLQVEFVEGERDTVANALRQDRACVVSEDFVTLTGLTVGDSIPFAMPNDPNKVVNYRIAGVVSLPGWQWITKFSGVRRHFVRTFTMVFADAERIRRDFDLQHDDFFWIQFEPCAYLPAIESALQRIAERNAGQSFDAVDYGDVVAYRPFARVTDTKSVRAAITMVADEVIWSTSRLPLLTLLITSLAVANTIFASVRSRRREYGVLRAIGTTRSEIVRLILAEGVLIAIVASALALAFGLLAGWCSVGMSRYSGMFYSPPTVYIPWLSLGVGFGAALLLSLICALWPAISTGRTEPLELLRNTGTAR